MCVFFPRQLFSKSDAELSPGGGEGPAARPPAPQSLCLPSLQGLGEVTTSGPSGPTCLPGWSQLPWGGPRGGAAPSPLPFPGVRVRAASALSAEEPGRPGHVSRRPLSRGSARGRLFPWCSAGTVCSAPEPRPVLEVGTQQEVEARGHWVA